MASIYKNITELTANLLELGRYGNANGIVARIVGKLEYYNLREALKTGLHLQ